MSLILDALRKSERTRQQSLTGQLGATETPPGPARMAVPWVTLLVILLVINVVVLAVFFWRGSDQHPAAPAAPATPPAAYHPEVRPLSEEAATPPEAAPPAPPPAAAAQPAPATPAPALSTAPAPAPRTTVSVVAQNADAGVPSLDTLPMDVRQTLPALHLDVLGYAMKPDDRFVVINFQRYRIGDTTVEGVRVTDIVPGGAILDYHGTRFLLPP